MQRPVQSERSARWACCPASQQEHTHPCSRPASPPCTALGAHPHGHTCLHAHVCTRMPAPAHSRHPAPSTHVPHTVTHTHTAGCACSRRPRHPHSNKRLSCCLPPLPAGVFAKQFPWRHILALTGAAECREDGLHGGDETRGLCILGRPSRQGQMLPPGETPPPWTRLAPEEVPLGHALGYMLQDTGHSVIQQTACTGCKAA